LAACLFAAFGLQRHHRFGSGSWDMGCYLHNAWMFGHGDAFSLQARSSVLGDVGFWGGENHFMPTLVLTGPLSWLMEWTGFTGLLIVVQAMIVAATVVALDGYGHCLELTTKFRAAIVVAFVVHGGTLSFIGFDVHELAPVPLCMVMAMWAAREGRLPAWWLWLLLLMGCKESAWLYGAALGGYMMLTATDVRARRHGLAALLFGAIGFWVVTTILQPAMSLPGDAMLHTARFAQLGPDLPAAAMQVLRHPIDALLLLVTPTIKAQTLAVTLLGMGFVIVWWPRAWPLLLVPLAERFWSNKTEMWGLGFHYSLVTVAVLALAAMDAMAGWQHRQRFQTFLFACIVVGIPAQLWASPHTKQLWSWQQPYFANDEQVLRYQRALSFVREDDKVVAQNHFLPHLALRRHIWQPKAEFIARASTVVLDVHASPWPDTAATIRSLVQQLRADPGFRLIFDEQGTVVFRRVGLP
jgi:uncharacterized membrane protein